MIKYTEVWLYGDKMVTFFVLILLNICPLISVYFVVFRFYNDTPAIFNFKNTKIVGYSLANKILELLQNTLHHEVDTRLIPLFWKSAY